MPADALFTVSGLSKTYGFVRALDDIHLSVRSGEILGLIGPNGAGKTTLFECLAEVQPSDAGVVEPNTHRSDLLFYMPDGISAWADQPVHWVLQYVLGLYRGRRDSDREKKFMLDRAQWHELKMTVNGADFKTWIDGQLALEYTFGTDPTRQGAHQFLYPKNNPTLMPPIAGKVGLWAKTDSTSYFKEYVITPAK